MTKDNINKKTMTENELRQFVNFNYGPSSWQEIIRLQAEIRKKQQEEEERRANAGPTPGQHRVRSGRSQDKLPAIETLSKSPISKA